MIKDDRVFIRVSQEEHDQLAAEAQKQGRTISGFVRYLFLKWKEDTYPKKVAH